MAPDHAQVQDEIAPYALEALDEQARAEVEAHLAGCAECSAQLWEYRAVVGSCPWPSPARRRRRRPGRVCSSASVRAPRAPGQAARRGLSTPYGGAGGCRRSAPRSPRCSWPDSPSGASSSSDGSPAGAGRGSRRAGAHAGGSPRRAGGNGHARRERAAARGGRRRARRAGRDRARAVAGASRLPALFPGGRRPSRAARSA